MVGLSREKVYGSIFILFGLLLSIAYIYLLLIQDNRELALLTMKITILLMILLVSGFLIWMGYTLVTTPPPKPIEEIEKEIEKEIKELEKKVSENKQDKNI